MTASDDDLETEGWREVDEGWGRRAGSNFPL